MDATVKKTIIRLFKRVIKAIDNGVCDNMTTKEIDHLIRLLEESKKIDETYIKRKRWIIF
jgi:hypothetical protein